MSSVINETLLLIKSAFEAGVNNTEVVSSTGTLGSIGGNGMIIGNPGSGSNALATTIDNFIVKKS